MNTSNPEHPDRKVDPDTGLPPEPSLPEPDLDPPDEGDVPAHRPEEGTDAGDAALIEPPRADILRDPDMGALDEPAASA